MKGTVTGTSKNAIIVVKLFESKNRTGHRNVAHQDNNNRGRKQHDPFRSVLTQIPENRVLVLFHDGNLISFSVFVIVVFILANGGFDYNGTKLRKVFKIMLFACFRAFPIKTQLKNFVFLYIIDTNNAFGS